MPMHNSVLIKFATKCSAQLCICIWRARSQSHVIDCGYEVIEDITLARAEMRLALAPETNVISDRELLLTTWFLSVTIWANHLKPQFQRRYFGLQPFNFYLGQFPTRTIPTWASLTLTTPTWITLPWGNSHIG